MDKKLNNYLNYIDKFLKYCYENGLTLLQAIITFLENECSSMEYDSIQEIDAVEIMCYYFLDFYLDQHNLINIREDFKFIVELQDTDIEDEKEIYIEIVDTKEFTKSFIEKLKITKCLENLTDTELIYNFNEED